MTQVDSIKTCVESCKRPWCQRLKVSHHKLLSTFDFNFNLRRYHVAIRPDRKIFAAACWDGRIRWGQVDTVYRCLPRRPPHSVPVLAALSITPDAGDCRGIHYGVYRRSTRHPPHIVPVLAAVFTT